MRSLLLLALLASPLSAQIPLPSIVYVPENVQESLTLRYAQGTERLWCVTKWTSEERDNMYTLYTVRAVEEVKTSASDREIAVNGTECRNPDGTAQPMIHSHPVSPTGCQASPQDLSTAIDRGAEFDGILCGARVTTWYFSWQARAAFAPFKTVAKSDSVTSHPE